MKYYYALLFLFHPYYR